MKILSNFRFDLAFNLAQFEVHDFRGGGNHTALLKIRPGGQRSMELSLTFFSFSRCPPCNGGGRVKCDVCKGHTRLKTFIQLTVTWYVYAAQLNIFA
jgi:hypothetical protein